MFAQLLKHGSVYAFGNALIGDFASKLVQQTAFFSRSFVRLVRDSKIKTNLDTQAPKLLLKILKFKLF